MWYVIWTTAGFEDKACLEINKAASDLLARIFTPKCRRNIKIKGEWTVADRPLYAGYIFVDTDDIRSLRVRLYDVPRFNKILDIDRDFYPLIDKDEMFIETLYNQNGLFDVSEGYIEGDNVVITSGPLIGLEGCITKINRHKRIAYLKLNMFGQQIKAKVGLEIFEKK